MSHEILKRAAVVIGIGVMFNSTASFLALSGLVPPERLLAFSTLSFVFSGGAVLALLLDT